MENLKTNKYYKKDRNILNSYPVDNWVYAGEYPGAKEKDLLKEKIKIFEKSGINDFIDLTEEGELLPYADHLNSDMRHYRFPIKDCQVPTSLTQMLDIVTCIYNLKSEYHKIYVHCWGGVGRTGTVVACWYVYNGYSADEALSKLDYHKKFCPKSRIRMKSPTYESQKKYVYDFEKYIIYENLYPTKNNNLIMGAICGDIIGSSYEHYPTKTLTFSLFDNHSKFTDDSVLTIATMDALMKKIDFSMSYKYWGNRYRGCGFGSTFYNWLISEDFQPYNSWGNGAAMRVSPVAYIAENLLETLLLAKESAAVTHNHFEAIKGAQSVASCIFMALNGQSKEDIRTFVEKEFEYNLHRKISEIRSSYVFDVSCQGSVPEAIIAFLESTDFESAIRLAVSLGGDSDTQAAIAGSIAEAYYKDIPLYIRYEVIDRLNKEIYDTLFLYNEFVSRVNNRI